MGNWADFFAAELGAAAALTGLVIVGISINVGRILAEKDLPGLAVETLVLPTGILVASTYALVPHQPDWLLGGAIGPTAGLPRVLLALLASWPFVISGILLVLQTDSALYWCVSGIVVALIATVINAWGLLVEILR